MKPPDWRLGMYVGHRQEHRRRRHLQEVPQRERQKVPADQKWFWTDRWQQMEREADADIAAGRVAAFEDVEDFLADLDA